MRERLKAHGHRDAPQVPESPRHARHLSCGRVYERESRIHGRGLAVGGVHRREGIQSAVEIGAWFDELAVLRGIVKDTLAASSPEGRWLFSIAPDAEQRTRRMIFISSNTWPAKANATSRYAESVAVSTSFGPLTVNPLMLLLMHELNVNVNPGTSGVSLMGEDSHIPEEDTRSAWETADQGHSKKLKSDSDRLDDLFQAQSGIALTALGRYFELIKALQ